MLFKRLFTEQSQSITGAAVLIAVFSFASRILGVIRDRILASQFAGSQEIDIYYTAFRLPDTVFTLLVLGAISTGFIPVFLDYLKNKGKEETFKLTNYLLNLLIISLILVCLILIIFTPALMPFIAPGFMRDAEKFTLAVNLTRIMFVSPILLGVSAILGGILQSYKQFFIYSLAPIMYNIGIIIGALFFVNFWGIYGLAYGVLLGALMHLLIQIPPAVKLGFKYRFDFKINEGIKKIIKLMIPRTLGLAVSQINFLVITALGSMISVGSIAIFNWTNNLQSFPIGIFAISLAIAAFPVLSEMALDKNKEKFVGVFSDTTRQILFFLLPISILLIVLRAQIIRVIFGTGKFDWQNTIMAADCLAFFSLSVWAQGLIPLIARAFYALRDTLTPFIIGLISSILNILLAFYFMKNTFFAERFSSIAGLVFAYSISQIVNFIILWVVLRIKIGSLQESIIIKAIFKISIASIVMGIATHLMKYAIEPLTGTTTFLGIFSQGFLAGLVGLILFFLVSYYLKLEELFVFCRSIKRKIAKLSFIKLGIDESEKE